MPALFALTFKGFGNLQMALFAAFGSFATLVLVGFAGTRRDKLLAHFGLAFGGSVLLVIGTAVTSTPVLAVIVTVPVTFAVFFLGVSGPNAATAVNGALLAYVLPAASPGSVSMVPDRLAGWWLASVIGTAAVIVLPTPSAGDGVRRAVTKLAQALGDALDGALRGADAEPLLQIAVERKHELLGVFAATPFRPTGLAIRDQALAGAVELLEWCTALVSDTLQEQPDLRTATEADRALFAAAARTLRDCGGVLAGESAAPDLDALNDQRRATIAGSRWAERPADDEDPRLAFHAHTIATAALAIGSSTLLAAQLVDPDQVVAERRRWFGGEQVARSGRLGTLGRYSRIAARHATVRSVWFVNSIRGSFALAAAVAVADAASVQHGFWVVLGTLSVLRSNASATGATALRALLGTVIGFVVGGALLLAIGTSTATLWVVLPLAVLIASYAPGVAPFTIGQAAFTITVAVLFNLLVPVGWKVGELRVEDVAIGCLVSMLVGLVFWPRGLAPLVGDDLADAFRSGAAYLRDAIDWVCGRASNAPVSASTAMTAGERLDEATRGFLAEQGTKHVARDELWRLIGATLRLRLTAHAIAELPHACASNPELHEAVGGHTEAVVAWYQQLARHVGKPERSITSLGEPQLDADALNDAHAGSRSAIWLREHLHHLTEHLSALIEPATHIAEIRRRPWWR
jgi:uncharacterized membrane protein YccC